MKLFSLTILLMLPVTSLHAMDSIGIIAYKNNMIYNNLGTPKPQENKSNSQRKPNPADKQNPKKQR